MKFRYLFSAAGIAVLSLVSPARSQTYSSSVLYPVATPSGYGSSVAVGQVAPGQTIGFAYPTGTNDMDAMLWTSAGAVDLNPTSLGGSDESLGTGAGGGQQIGTAYVGTPQPAFHAILWTGSGASAIDLNPTNLIGAVESHGFGTNGMQQVGDVYMETGTSKRDETVNQHAVLWTGSAGSAVDLNPTNMPSVPDSEALATDGNQQVGYGMPGFGYTIEAVPMLWSGTAASAVNLMPTDLPTIGPAEAVALGGNEQVGWEEVGSTNAYHALLWTGTAASAVDLTPSGATSAQALGTNGVQQLGYAVENGNSQALLWDGTAASAFDLNPFLPATGVWTSADAYTFDSAGNIYGLAFGTLNGVSGTYAVEWSPVPEPAATGIIIICTSAGLTLRRRNPDKRTV